MKTSWAEKRILVENGAIADQVDWPGGQFAIFAYGFVVSGSVGAGILYSPDGVNWAPVPFIQATNTGGVGFSTENKAQLHPNFWAPAGYLKMDTFRDGSTGGTPVTDIPNVNIAIFGM